MSETVEDMPWSLPLRVADLPGRKPHRFDVTPDGAMLAAIAAWAGIVKVEKLRLKGELVPVGKRDLELRAELGATVTQDCIITLEPVRTRLDETVLRRYVAGWTPPEGDEVEMPEDDTVEALPAMIDLGHVALEALELSLPLYPRKDGAHMEDVNVAEPGVEAMTDEDTKPFANLRALMDRKDD